MRSFKAFKKQLLKDPKFKKAYDNLGPEFELVKMLIKKRLEQKLTQAQLAKKIGTKQSAISRLEQGSYNPSINFLKKVSTALNADLKIFIT
ncbi:MAG: helix-turn-helix transcriptional regulator [Candidatus Doudnabacteria bacterium]|nr:helix-turn-helix transcriptional regulator [Candidatus Doudnabacteria bacterium]